MRSSAAETDRQECHLSKIVVRLACVAALGFSQFTLACIPASAMNVGVAGTLGAAAANDDPIIPVRAAARGGRVAVGTRGGAVVRRGGAVVGPRGGAAVRRTAVVGPRGNVAVRNTAVVAGRGRWARPGWYRWPVGGAIAAGAAIGFATAATAAAWAGAAPAPGMCWYYTDPSRTQGFWDYCPQ
jgi:hypothetical protein